MPTPLPPPPSPPTIINLTVLISGNGSNLQALIDATSTTTTSPRSLPNFRITHVISNRRSAHGLVRAHKAGIRTSYHALAPYRASHPADAAARGAYDADLAMLVLGDDDNDDNDAGRQRPDIVVCAGWMHVLSGAFLGPLGRAAVEVVNLHPALPGEFLGCTDAIVRAWREGRDAGRTRTGVMLHRVVEEVDRGEVVFVKEVEVRQAEGCEEFEARVHEIEWDVVVEGVRRVGERVREGKGERGMGLEGGAGMEKGG